jgi:hypothetical protein
MPPGTLDNPDPEFEEICGVDAFEVKNPNPELLEKGYLLARKMAELSIEKIIEPSDD